MLSRGALHFSIVTAAAVALVSTLFIPTEVRSRPELSTVRLGLPWHFVVQDQSGLDPPSYPTACALISPAEFPAKLDVVRAAGAFVLVVAALESLIIALRRRRRSRTSR